ncbi:MAG: alanine--tRNA ligase [Gammaproteobacteria bacterium]|nr:alanine--tRNA ligase [Gammaproteobacteria bacterium]
MTSTEIRQAFLNYFKSKGHTIVPSSSLIPGNDPTLLFTNAGMVPFKDVFLGSEHRAYTRAASAQCCIRAGGKHNDLDNVGYTARHHTFFEMLGNFSFGDYFKEDAIKMAWEFITEKLQIPKEKLTVTVHDSDQEAENIWINKIGVPKERVIRCGDKDNFWTMGDTGPCGPCTEIFYDHGPEVAGGPPGSPEADGDRFIEIWNLVFMQFNRSKDGIDTPLPKPSVDTGMGLERLSAVMQSVHNNYDTDLFMPIIKHAQKLYVETHKSEQAAQLNCERARFNIMADHIRSSAFLISQGTYPSNEGRGYVLRRIIRRAVRQGYQLKMPQHFFSRLVPSLVDVMGEAYPDLVKAQTNVESVLRREEDAFAQTLDQGMKLLEKALSGSSEKIISGEVIFKLYDTYGFPVDLTADVARERGLEMDLPGFERCMAEQKAQSRNAGKFDVDYNEKEKLATVLQGQKTEFLRDTLEKVACKITHSIKQSDVGAGGARSILVLEETPFYPEGGGQVGDTGKLSGKDFIFRVENTTREGEAILHHGHFAHGNLDIALDVIVEAEVDVDRRKKIMRHHSATHLLHEALQKILGSHVQQKGSLVAPDRLRFDFSHFEPITKEQLRQIEEIVNAHVVDNDEVCAKEMAIDAAKAAGAMALFGEKYGDEVRTIKMGTSFELCGGTHVSRTGDIGAFKIISEGSIASGIRRIEAVAGALAWQAIYHEQAEAEQQKNFAAIKQRELEKSIDALQAKLSAQGAESLLTQVRQIESINLLVVNVPNVDAKALSSMIEFLKSKLNYAVIVLGTRSNDAACLAVGVTPELHAKIKAGDLVKYLAPHIDGQGGGRADVAQAGGKSPEKLTAMLALVEPWVKSKLV